MTDKAKTFSIGAVFAVMGSFVAFAIGSGFSTGQEILQYFTSYGLQGILVAVAVFIADALILVEFITTGKREQFDRGGDIYTYYCGKYIGKFYDWFTALFVYMSFVVMVGGASATFNQYFHAPYAVGGILLCIAAGLTVIFGLKGVVNVIGKIGPCIILIVLIIAIPALFRGDSLESSLQTLDQALEEGTVLKASSTWWLAAYSYVGFGLLWYAPFLASLGKTLNSKKEAVWGQVLGAFVFMGTAVIVCMALLLNLKDITGAQVPMLALALKLSPTFSVIFAIIIMLAIYSSAVPLLWTATAPFVDDTTTKGKIIILAAAAVGCFIGLAVPFDRLINIIYVLNGYLGGLIIIFVIVKFIRRTIANKNQNGEVVA